MTANHSVKQYIDESLPALLEKSVNLMLWKVVTLWRMLHLHQTGQPWITEQFWQYFRFHSQHCSDVVY